MPMEAAAERQVADDEGNQPRQDLSVIGSSLDKTLELLEDSRRSFEEVLKNVGGTKTKSKSKAGKGEALTKNGHTRETRKTSPARDRAQAKKLDRGSGKTTARYQDCSSKKVKKDPILSKKPEIMKKLADSTQLLAQMNEGKRDSGGPGGPG